MKLWRCKDEMIVLVIAIIFSAYNIYPTFEQQLTNLQSILNFFCWPQHTMKLSCLLSCLYSYRSSISSRAYKYSIYIKYIFIIKQCWLYTTDKFGSAAKFVGMLSRFALVTFNFICSKISDLNRERDHYY